MNKDWMTEEHGVPHKNGMVRFYLIGIDEDVFGYLGWYDMTDWDKGLDKVLADALASRNGDEDFQVLRHDQLEDLARNVQWALFEALEDKDETTWSWWYREEREAKAKGEDK
jgi:hypothetical protein